MQSWREGRIWVGKGAQTTGMTASLRIQSSKADSNTLGELHKEWTEAGVSASSHHAQSSSGKGLPSHFWTRDNVRSILPGLWRKRTGLLEHFMLPSADKLYGDADFIFEQDLAPAHTAKSTKSWLNDHGVGVLDWPANSPDLNPLENLWGIVKRKMRDTRPNNADDLKATVKETWASIPPQQCHKLITSMPRRIEAVIKAKGAPAKYCVHIQ